MPKCEAHRTGEWGMNVCERMRTKGDGISVIISTCFVLLVTFSVLPDACPSESSTAFTQHHVSQSDPNKQTGHWREGDVRVR